LDNVTLSFLPGAKIGVVGPNGAGKSSVLKIMAGLDVASNGDALLAPGYSVGILLQEPPLEETLDVRGNVDIAVKPVKDMVEKFNEIAEKMAIEYTDELGNEMGVLQDQIDHAGGWDLDSRIEMAMDALRLPPGDADVTVLSGGERRRVALCRLLLEQPDLLLLDEPTNHLDAESVAWLEQHLAAYAGTVLAVTHDRYFLDNVAEWILELDRGHAYPYEGNYTTYLETKSSRLKVEGNKDAKRKKEIERELEWVRSNPRARQAKSKARLARFDELVAEADRHAPIDSDSIQIPAGPRLGSQVIETDKLRKGFGDRILIDDLSFSLPPGGIVGVMGPNGVGKTTLFKMIIGDEQPDAGELKIGPTVEISYVDQSRAGLEPKKTLWETVSGGTDYIRVGKTEINSRAYVASFGFKGPDQQKPTGVLSGGERNRLNLALTLKSGGNLLLLDEPTNDLDVETLRSLEDALEDFPGCAVVISHDRWFLDKVATHILSWEGTDDEPGRWYWFEGGFSDYERNKVERLGEEAARPHRVTHRRLARD
jgi:ATP-binding cassette ChvD family protein